MMEFHARDCILREMTPSFCCTNDLVSWNNTAYNALISESCTVFLCGMNITWDDGGHEILAHPALLQIVIVDGILPLLTMTSVYSPGMIVSIVYPSGLIYGGMGRGIW